MLQYRTKIQRVFGRDEKTKKRWLVPGIFSIITSAASRSAVP
jgi:hypothetical protein